MALGSATLAKTVSAGLKIQISTDPHSFFLKEEKITTKTIIIVEPEPAGAGLFS